MKMYTSRHQDEPITHEAALFEEFGSIAESQCVSPTQVRELYLTDQQTRHEVNAAMALREVQK